MANALTDQVRTIIDLICKFGDSVKTEPAERIFDLRGAGRVTIRQEGLRCAFKLEASGARIEASSWRGQWETASGDLAALPRLAENAATISGIIASEQDIEKRARYAALGAPQRR